jgi:acyl-CoA synthetase (AMP-forming)/AMP-acid ligase II/acyl carrier protein
MVKVQTHVWPFTTLSVRDREKFYQDPSRVATSFHRFHDEVLNLDKPSKIQERFSRSLTLTELLQECGQDTRPLVHFCKGATITQSWTGAEVWQNALYSAAVLRQHKVRGPVFLAHADTKEFARLFLGCVAAGIPVAPLAPFEFLQSGEFVSHLNTMRKVGRIQGNLFTQAPARALKSDGEFQVWNVDDFTPPREVATENRQLPVVGPRDICFLQFSSGSTREPKAVVVQHDSIMAHLEQIRRGMDPQEDDVAASWLPLYHDMGLIGGFLSPLYNRKPLYLHSPLDFIRHPGEWLAFIMQHRARVLMGPDYMYKTLARWGERIPAGVRLDSVRLCLTGSEPVRPQTCVDFVEAFAACGLSPDVMMPVYGMAEAVLAVTFHQAGSPLRSLRVEAESYFGGIIRALPAKGESSRSVLSFLSCGRPLPGIEIEIHDEAGLRKPEGFVGEIWIRSEAQSEGYWRAPEATAEKFQGGWLRSGDLGFIWKDQLFITGRIKDLVIQRGRKFHAVDLENELHVRWPQEIRRVAVVSCDDFQGQDERICVVLEPKKWQLKYRSSWRAEIAQHLGRFAHVHPQDVFVIPKGALPRTTSGKLKRYQVKTDVLNGRIARLDQAFVVETLRRLRQGLMNKTRIWLQFRLPRLDWVEISPRGKSPSDPAAPIRAQMVEIFATIAGVPESQVELEKPFLAYNLDSLKVVALNQALENRFGELSILQFYQFRHLQDVLDFLVARQSANSLES